MNNSGQVKASECVALMGASSGIARAVAMAMARRGVGLILAGRDAQQLQAMSSDLNLRFGVATRILEYEGSDIGCVDLLAEQLRIASGQSRLRGVIIFQGIMPQVTSGAAMNAQQIDRMARVNFIIPALLLERITGLLDGSRDTFIAALSSVAGERGRASNYPYGSTKAALTTWMAGLQHRLKRERSSTRVLIIHPGMVATAMTHGLVPQRSPLVAEAGPVGERIARACLGKSEGVIHVPWFWKWILLLIRLLPDRLFHRTSL